MKEGPTLRQKSKGQVGRAHSVGGSGGPRTLWWEIKWAVHTLVGVGVSSGPCTLWWSGTNSAVTQNFCKFIMESTGGEVNRVW